MKCIVCNKEFTKKMVWQKFCSRFCRWGFWKKKKDPEREKIYQKYRNLRRRYQMTREEYDEMEKRQNGRCAICDVKPEPPYRGLGVDHCHKSGKNRGLLCANCNRRIVGAIEKVGLKNVANYLGYEIKEKKVVC